MKKFYLGILIISMSLTSSVYAATTKTTTAKYEPVIPKDFSSITWAKSLGINSYFKAPKDNGAIDYITRIYLPQNQINFIISKEPTDLGLTGINKNTDTAPFGDEITPANKNINNFHNLSFERVTTEFAKSIDSSIKFIWDAQFFNMKNGSSDLSMAIKYSKDNKTTITSGSRSVVDMGKNRRMLIINNKNGTAIIKDFDSATFVDDGDQALEGFSPMVEKSDSSNGAASRLFLGVSDDGKELIVYCSQLATIKDASNALIAAGVSIDHQLQADGGGSASCGYNLPGQYFVEPTRTLPILMGAKTILARGKVNTATLNVRNKPSTKGDILYKLLKDEEVQAFEEKDGWYKIGDDKWVMKAYIK